jgi:hypothetical protein
MHGVPVVKEIYVFRHLLNGKRKHVFPFFADKAGAFHPFPIGPSLRIVMDEHIEYYIDIVLGVDLQGVIDVIAMEPCEYFFVEPELIENVFPCAKPYAVQCDDLCPDGFARAVGRKDTIRRNTLVFIVLDQVDMVAYHR